ncbi:MAG TPA: plastocyanin/azurin family copper-binding protein, partial [Nitrososphaera sp.]|nr:plastocyanin/azurin family copper-binding protein [Nitrososphaera sp.]
MNTKIAVAVGLAAILVSMFALPQAALAAEVNVSITTGSSTKTTNAYSPNPVEIAIGDTVIWTNEDSTPHTAASGTTPTPDGVFGGNDQILVTGKTQSHTFSEAGEFPYFCTLHPTMVGTVIVGEGGNGATGEFTTTASLDGNDYEITGKSATVMATAATIEAGKAVKVTF